MPSALRKTKSPSPALAANAQPPAPGMLYLSAPVEIQAAAAPAGGSTDAALPTFKMNAYSGGPMRLALFWGQRAVVDLAGVVVLSEQTPALRDHDPARVVGHSTAIKIKASGSGKGIFVEGVVSGTGTDAEEVVGNSKNGFKWQVSIGGDPERTEYLEAGKKAKVNGQDVVGPLYIVRALTLKEVSFVALGADGNTSASVAAQLTQENSLMKFEEWLKAHGFDQATLPKERLAILAAMHAGNASGETVTALKASWEGNTTLPATPPAPPSPAGAPLQAGAMGDMLKAQREILAAEAERVAKIHKLCAGRFPEIEARAIRDGDDPVKVELEVLRAERPTAPAGHVITRECSALVLEAAVCLTRRMPDVEKQYDAKTLDAAHRHYRNIGLQQLLLAAAVANGLIASPGARIHQGNVREVLEAAMPIVRMRAAATTIDVAGILSNIANKELLAGYMEEDQTWREVSVVKSVSDFKSVTSYRMLDDMEYEEIGPDGEIKHGTLGEETYTRQAKTYAKMGELTRTDIINDDMGAFDDLRSRIGAGGGKKMNKVFWSRWLNNAAFFTADLGNYITGAGTALGADGAGLEAGVTAFRKLRTPVKDGQKRVGNVVGGRPEILLVPPELEHVADRLHKNSNLGAGTKNADANIHANKYRPVVADWLSDPNFPGYSSTAWYLLRNPKAMAAAVVSFLNGVETPTVEMAAADFNKLGILLRGFHDFGVDLAEPLAGIKAKGTA